MLSVNSERLKSYVEAFTSFDMGGTPTGGVSRPAASDADKVARDKFRSLARQLGLEVKIDDIGNMYARKAGSVPNALPVIIGSHLDTVVPGGKYDGILGVALAFEAIAALEEQGMVTKRPIIIVNWTGEEGARFPPAMIGTGVVTGVWDVEYARSRVDSEGFSLGDELQRIGYLGARENRVQDFFASLEAHIEQGVQLEASNNDVGIVPYIEPVQWSTVRVIGPGGHAGGQAVSKRDESVVAAARMIVAARNLAGDGDRFKATVGNITARPGSNNVIPHETCFNLDVRSHDPETLECHLAELERQFESIAKEENVYVELDHYWSLKGPRFDSVLTNLLEVVAKKKGVRWTHTVGTIGHDSLHLARKGPTAMLFTRTVNGLSHCEEEDIPWESAVATAEVYTTAVLTLAQARSYEELLEVL